MDRNLSSTARDDQQAQGSASTSQGPRGPGSQTQSQSPSALPSRRATPTPVLITSIESKRASTSLPLHRQSSQEQVYETLEGSPQTEDPPPPPPKRRTIGPIDPSQLETAISTRRHTLASNLAADETAPLRVLDRTRTSKDVLRPGVDWIVPARDVTIYREKTVGERLEPTLAMAREQRDQYALKAKLTGWSLNIAIGVQILLGSLTTGLSVVVSGKQVAILTTILGGLSTLVASYLARARGSNEPELSISRVKDLEQFIRECEAFRMDHGHVSGDGRDADLSKFREQFEELLGNANGERRLSPPV